MGFETAEHAATEPTWVATAKASMRVGGEIVGGGRLVSGHGGFGRGDKDTNES
jgi:hypothetical protein